MDPKQVVNDSDFAFPKDIVEVVSRENHRAAEEAPPKDLGEAEQVLRTVTDQLKSASKADLRNLHRLEGLVHVFPG